MEETELCLPKSIIEGIKNISSRLNKELSKKLLSNIVKLALFADHSIPSNPEVSATNPDYVKQYESVIISLLVLALNHDYDHQMVTKLFQSFGLPSEITDEITKIYDACKHYFVCRNIKTGINLPHLSEVDWTVNSDFATVDNNKICHINLSRFNNSNCTTEHVEEFDCNAEELHYLIMKLKDIENQCNLVSKIN